MNNVCPSCGALYNVTPSDIGRRLKCKKCGTALRVADSGLVQDDDPVETEAPPESEPKRADEHDREPPRKKRRRDEPEPNLAPSVNTQVILQWVPTALFAAGVFFVIVFTALPIIGRAGNERAAANKERLENEMAREKFNLQPNKPRNEWLESERKRIDDETPKIEARYERDLKRATLDAESTRTSNIRNVWLEQYGLMFGLILVAFGCIGYLRINQTSDYSLVIKIVAGTILVLMMLAMFGKFAGCVAPR